MWSVFAPLALFACAAVASEDTWAHPQPSRLPVIPEPRNYTFGDGHSPICLSPDFTIQLPASVQGNGDLARAVQRTTAHLFTETHQWLSVHRGSEFWLEDARAGEGGSAGAGTADTVPAFKDCSVWLKELRLLLDDADLGIDVTDKENLTVAGGAMAPVGARTALEPYQLDLPLNGPATITAHTALGLFRGLSTFEQLFYRLNEKEWLSSPTCLAKKDDDVEAPLTMLGTLRQATLDWINWGVLYSTGTRDPSLGRRDETHRGRIYAPLAPYSISDSSEFGWRGVMIDTARHFFPISVIERTLDAMALAKLNVFHWHITDADSWPLNLAAYPEVARGGAYSPSMQYSEQQVRDVITYASERGIDVLLEIDMPSHTGAIAASHPEHIACADLYWDDYAAKPPPGQLRHAVEATEAWAQGYIAEVTKLVRGRYMGTGGDEPSERCYEHDGPTQEALRRRNFTLNDAMNSFTGAIHHPIRAAGKTPVVWQEAALEFGDMPCLSNLTAGGDAALVSVWKSSQDAGAVIDKGHKVIHCAGRPFYLDSGHGWWLDTKNATLGGQYYSWHSIINFDPFANLTKTQRKSVYGGQVNAWAEQIDETSIDSILWPRAAAAAELWWGGDRGEGHPRDARKWLPGMQDLRYRMVARGIGANAMQPHYCALRPETGVCGFRDDA